MNKYVKHILREGWIICEGDKDFANPCRTCTFAFDTETFVYLDDEKVDNVTVLEKSLEMETAEKRTRFSTRVWAWQCYDEYNGFFMTNNFYYWLNYQAKCNYKFGWCYNAKFDFSQIDYQVLTDSRWIRHTKNTGKGYDKGQAWAFESLHNDMGTRYAYKLWVPYKNKNRHIYVHPVEYRDFMNIFSGGLARMLESLDVCDNYGCKIRKMQMEYQDVNENELTHDEIIYCVNDVKGLYFGVKKYNEMIEAQSKGERHIFGTDTNVMTAGGFAKAELLRSLYPGLSPKRRLKHYQKEHPISIIQDDYLRKNHLYRGGITLVNKMWQGKLLNRTLYRYDSNSEYPFCMSIINDLIDTPQLMSFLEWQVLPDKSGYECIYILEAITGSLRRGYIPVWYNPFIRDYVADIDECGTHLMFERELQELSYWYDLEYVCEKVLIYVKGEKVYAPFVYENYELKSRAKAEKNNALSNVAKLKLNSSYGKLAERAKRDVGEYRLNEESGAVHFVKIGQEIEEKGLMSVAIGALVTAVARIWLLSTIREICGENVEENFVYCDTDSIHTFCEYEKSDPHGLGAFKLEAVCSASKYLCPKSYIDIEATNNGFIAIENGKPQMEIHAKGINITSVKNDFFTQITPNGLPIDYVEKRFDYGQKFPVLCAMNVKGGKVLLPTYKYLAKDDLRPDEDITISSGYDGHFLSEK